MELRSLALEGPERVVGRWISTAVAGLCCVVSLGVLGSGCSSSPETEVAKAPAILEGMTPEEWVRQGLEPLRKSSDSSRAWGYGGGQDESDLESFDDLDASLEGLDDEPAMDAEDAPGAAASGDESLEGEIGGDATDDLESPFGDDGEEAPEVTPPVRRPTPVPADEPRRAPRGAASADDIFNDMKRDQSTAGGRVEQLLDLAENASRSGDYTRAESYLEQVLLIDPDNQRAEVLLAEVRHILGDSAGEVAQDFFDQEALHRDWVRAQVRRALADGASYEELEEYDRAIQSYRRAIDLVRSDPFDLQLDAELRQAQASMERAQKLQRAFEAAERQRRLKLIEEKQRADAESSFEYLKSQIRELHRRAQVALDAEDFEKAARLYESVLELNPRDEVAKRNLRFANQQAHIHAMDEYTRRAVENYELAVLGVEESSIVFEDIFRYPKRDDWLRLAPRVTTLEERVAQTQSVEEKEINRRLESLVPSFAIPEQTSLKDVLAELQNLSGVNFFIQSGQAGELADAPIRLDQVDQLPLKNLLRLILGQAGDDVGYVVDEGAVTIGPREGLAQPTYFQSYEISDLIKPKPDFPAQGVGLEELAGRNQSADIQIDTGGEPVGGGGTLPVEDLIGLIARELRGPDATEVEGIRFLEGKLSARIPLEDHIKLAKILDRLRLSTGMMVTCESRFLDIQDNFLEQIGVNWGGTSSNLPNTIPDADGTGTALAPGYEFVDARGEFNLRAASVGNFSNPLGSQVNPFNMSASGGGAYQLNVLDAERFQLEAILTGVAKTQEIRRLNSPRVTAFNSQTAHTLVVQQAAYIQDLEVNQTGVIPVINPVIGVLNTGSILEVRPTISYDQKYVTLEIQPTLAEEIGRDVAVLNLSGNFTVVPVQLPILSVTKIKTTVSVPDGGTVLVGGLKREVTSKMSVGMPFLRRIPILNLLFGRWGTSTLRSNLFVLINSQITIVHEEEAELFGTSI